MVVGFSNKKGTFAPDIDSDIQTPFARQGFVNVGDNTYSKTDARQFTDARRTAITTTRTDSRQYTDARVYAPTTQLTIDSPNANVSSKKDASSAPTQTAPVTYVPIDQSGAIQPSQDASAEATKKPSGMGTLLLIGGVAIVGAIAYKRFGGD